MKIQIELTPEEWEKLASENPTGPESGFSRVIRGGTWYVDADNCRSAYRYRRHPSCCDRVLGFRLSRTGSEPIPGLRDPLPDGTAGPAMVWLPGGTFTMGQDDSQWGDEKPAHPARLGAFSIGQYPVTFAEYDRFCAATGARKPDDWGWGRGNRPVIDVSWHDAVAYCDWLSRETGRHYRLPTEAEWEYACRAGTATRWSCGDDESLLGDHAWYYNNTGGKTHPVGEKLPNAWGLYDMHGNVWEWCQDWYGPYAAGPVTDPVGPATGEQRVLRGGSWLGVAVALRSACRLLDAPGDRGRGSGFRLALSL